MSAQGDEWLHRLAECVAAAGGHVDGTRIDATTQPFVEVRGTLPTDRSSESLLLLLPLGEALLLFVGGIQEPPDEDAWTLWLSAARCATERLGPAGVRFREPAPIAPPYPPIAGLETPPSPQTPAAPAQSNPPPSPSPPPR